MTQRIFETPKRVAQLDRLERQNRRTRVGLAVLAAGFLGAMSVGATSSPSIPNLLVAESCRVVGEQGGVGGGLDTHPPGRGGGRAGKIDTVKWNEAPHHYPNPMRVPTCF